MQQLLLMGNRNKDTEYWSAKFANFDNYKFCLAGFETENSTQSMRENTKQTLVLPNNVYYMYSPIFLQAQIKVTAGETFTMLPYTTMKSLRWCG